MPRMAALTENSYIFTQFEALTPNRKLTCLNVRGKIAGPEFTKITHITELLAEYASDHTTPDKTLIGDDAAIINLTGQRLNLFASDVMVEGIHFKRSYFSDAEIGYRSISTNVSDMAAMGGCARYATIALCCDKAFDISSFYHGVKLACEDYDLRIAGGDLSSSENIVVSVAMIGESYHAPIKRSSANEGDYIFVTGDLGASAAGLDLLQKDPTSVGGLQNRHKLPKAKVKEALALSNSGASSAIDISDGFIADLDHICTQSNLGARLEEVPVADGATLEQALYGGEDYELIFSHPDPDQVIAAFSSLGLPAPIQVGRFTHTKGVRLGSQYIDVTGFQHDL